MCAQDARAETYICQQVHGRRSVDGPSGGRGPILAEGDVAGLEDWAKQPSTRAAKVEQDTYWPYGHAGAQSSPPGPAASCGLASDTRAARCPKTQVAGGESQQAAPWGCPTGSCRAATSLGLSSAGDAGGGASRCCHSHCTAVLPGHSAAQRPLRREGVPGQGPSLSQADGGREDTSTLSLQQ